MSAIRAIIEFERGAERGDVHVRIDGECIASVDNTDEARAVIAEWLASWSYGFEGEDR